MNQILISETLYVTPEIRRKKMIYKINFFVAVFLMIILFFYYIYAEYDRYIDNQKSEQILSSLNFSIDEVSNGTIRLTDDKMKIVLNAEKKNKNNNNLSKRTPEEEEKIKKAIAATTQTSPTGDTYHSIGEIKIPKIDVQYPIVNKFTDELMRIAPVRFYGPDPNEIGNLCIVAHNYRNNAFFSKVPLLNNGDIIEIKDLLGNVVQYSVYDKFQVTENDTTSTTQYTDGKKEVTLITCTNDTLHRVIVKARAIQQ